LYHALIHKKVIAADYMSKLNLWFSSSELPFLHDKLNSYMGAKSYSFTEPYDLSVYYSPKDRTIRRNVFYKYLSFKSKIYNLIYG